MSISSSSSSSSNKYIRSVEIGGEDKAKTEVIYNEKKAPLELNGIRVFINIHNAIYERLYKDTENIAQNRASFKLQTVCKYSYASKKGDDEDDDKMELIKRMLKTSGVIVEVPDDDDGYLAQAFVGSKSMEASLSSLDDSLQSQKMEVNEKYM
jgi:hypothetical protein